MRNIDVIENFTNGKTGTASNLTSNGMVLFSYGSIIAYKVNDFFILPDFNINKHKEKHTKLLKSFLRKGGKEFFEIPHQFKYETMLKMGKPLIKKVSEVYKNENNFTKYFSTTNRRYDDGKGVFIIFYNNEIVSRYIYDITKFCSICVNVRKKAENANRFRYTYNETKLDGFIPYYIQCHSLLTKFDNFEIISSYDNFSFKNVLVDVVNNHVHKI